MKKYLACTVALAVPLLVGHFAMAQTNASPPVGPAAVTTTPAVPPTRQVEPMSPAPEAAANLSASDKMFVTKAAQGGAAEVQMAQLAQQKSENAEIKQFAQTMIDDHTPNNADLAKLATTKGLTPPSEPNAMQQKMLTHLQGLNGAKFDKAYVTGQIKAHTAMLKLFRTESKTTKDAELKNFSIQTSTVVEHHLAMAQGLSKSGA